MATYEIASPSSPESEINSPESEEYHRLPRVDPCRPPDGERNGTVLIIQIVRSAVAEAASRGAGNLQPASASARFGVLTVLIVVLVL